jgi:hypothetical protein
LHVHVEALALLPLLAGHDEQVDACAAEYEPAKQGRQLAPLVLKVPGEHAVQTREAPEPASAKPAVQLHEAEASTLVLPAGHAVQDVSPALLYVSTPQAVQLREPPVPVER